MSERWREIVVPYYREKLRTFGPGAKGMDWRDEASQDLRFAVIDRHVQWSPPPTVLDVGCGSGALSKFFARRGERPLRYLGIDVVPEMVEACRARCGNDAARIATIEDVRQSGERFDYVVASGTFNVRGDLADAQWREHVERSLAEMYAVCDKAVIFNALTVHLERRYPRLFYMPLDLVAELATTRLSRRFVIDHNYPLFEFTMAIFREPVSTAP